MARTGARAPQWLRSIARRPAAALTLAVLAALATIAAASAPLLDRAVEQAALTRALDGATLQQTSVVGMVSESPDVEATTALKVAALVPAAVRHPALWGPPQVLIAQAEDPVVWGPNGSVAERMVGTVGCAGIRLTAGRCVTAKGEALLPAETARREHVTLGSRVDLLIAPPDFGLPVRIVGLYDPAVGRGALLAAPERLQGAVTRVSDPDVIVVQSQLTGSGRDGFLVPTNAWSVRTVRRDLPVTALAQVRQDLAAVDRTALGSTAAVDGLSVSTQLDALLDTVDGQRTAAAIVLAVVAVQALLLAWFALAIVVLRIARARAAEWGLVRLRGIPRRRRLAMSAVEPAVALVVGAAAGLGVTALIGRPVALAAVGVRVPALPPEAVEAAGIALAGMLVALVVALVRTARVPLPTLLRRTTEPRRLSRAVLVGQVIVFVATAAAIQALSSRSGIVGDRVALLAPGLIALTVGLVAVLVGTLLVRRSTRRAPGSLAGLVVGRGLARTPSQLTAAVMVTVGVSLAVLVLQASSQADRTADIAALARAGAPVVLRVQVPAALSLIDAVDRADPDGRSAMAAEELTSGGNVGRIVAVDTSRFGALTTWLPSWAGTTAARLRTALAPPTGSSLTIRGSRITVTLHDLKLPDLTAVDPFAVVVTVQSARGLQEVLLPNIQPATRIVDGSLTQSADLPCSDGCRMVSIGMVENTPPNFLGPWSASATIAALHTDVESAAAFTPWLTTAGRWAPQLGHIADTKQPTRVTLQTSSAGLAVTLRDFDGGLQPSIRIHDTTEPLPALVSDTTGTQAFAGFPRAVYGTALDNTSIIEQVVGHAQALPRSMGDGVLVDLNQMLLQSDTESQLPVHEVWTTVGAAPRITAALHAEGVVVLGTDTLRGWTAQYRDEVGPVSARLAQLSGICALLLVLVAVVGLRVVGGAARRREWRSYLDGGVSIGRLRRLVALEFLLPAGSGCVLGAGAGLLAFALARAHLPLFDASGGIPPIPITPPVSLAAIVLLVIGLLAALAVPIARLETGEERA